MAQQTKQASPIETIAGKNPILLIAPHGRKEDDTNTGKLTRLLAERLKCYAVINEHYQRPMVIDPKTKEEKPGPAIPQDELFDLNNLTHVRKHLNNEFLKPILDFKNKITATHKATVVLIHGLNNDNAYDKDKKSIDLFIGIGLDNPASKPLKNRPTFPEAEAEAEKLKIIFGGLAEPITAEIYRGRDGYSGWDRNNLNQLFTALNNENDPKVQSIQLEIKKKGFRDTTENIRKTAERLSIALAELVGIDLSEQEVIAETGTAVAISQGETLPDITLVERAYQTLADIFTRHYENALLEAGHYLVKEFYGGNIELARAKEPTKGQSLNQLIERFQSRDAGSPSRSWIYNAVNMVVDNADFGAVQTYGQLGLSHRIVLLPVDAERKKELIEETVSKGYTVRQLKDRIAETKPKSEISLYQVIAKPDLLFSPDYSSQIDAKFLTTLPPATIDKLRAKAQEQIKKIGNEIATQQTYAGRYAELIQLLDTANKQEISVSGNQEATGTREWAVHTVNCCTGCSNNCRYCYAREMAVRFGHIKKVEDWGTPLIRKKDVQKKYKKYEGRVMFPSAHDITPDNFGACNIVLSKLLKAGNDVLVVSKPNFECIRTICDTFVEYKDKILFRFTIGATDSNILSFWEPNAPSYEERKKALEYAFNKGFQTSVSAEPLLDAAHIDDLVAELLTFITDALWIGKMNKIKGRVAITDDAVKEAVAKIETGQSNSNIIHMCARYEKNKKIKWKDSIKRVVGIVIPDKPGMDI